MIFYWFRAKDRVSLARACLSICKYSAIVALKESMTHLETDLIEYSFLVHKLPENLVKTKIIFFYPDRLLIQNLNNVFLRHLL